MVNSLGFHNQVPSPRRTREIEISQPPVLPVADPATSAASYADGRMWKLVLASLHSLGFLLFTALAITVGVWDDFEFKMQFVDPLVDIPAFNASYCECRAAPNASDPSCNFDFASCGPGSQNAVFGASIESGELVQNMLIAIAALSAVGCGFAVLHFLRFEEAMIGRVCLPSRWIDMALTLGLSAAICMNVAHIVDLYVFVQSAIAVIAFMFLARGVEENSAHGQIVRSVQLLVPASLLYAGVWIPFLRSTIENVHPLVCTEEWPSCGEATCLGQDAGLLSFLYTMFSLFMLIPVLLATKVLYLGGWFRIVEEAIGLSSSSSLLLIVPLRVVMVLPLSIVGIVVGIVSMVYHLGDQAFLSSPSPEQRYIAFYAAEVGYAALNLAIKATLICFFLFDLAPLRMY